jgi:GNAT superfamily N-acetyltransferase
VHPLELQVLRNPTRSDVMELDDQIGAFNYDATNARDFLKLGIFLRGPDGALDAGLYGYSWGGCLSIRLLWVRDALRGTGYGTQLLERAEREARDRGCGLVTLESHSFQAPEFYRRHGYEEFGALADYPIGHTKHFFKKSLKAVTREPE